MIDPNTRLLMISQVAAHPSWNVVNVCSLDISTQRDEQKLAKRNYSAMWFCRELCALGARIMATCAVRRVQGNQTLCHTWWIHSASYHVSESPATRRLLLAEAAPRSWVSRTVLAMNVVLDPEDHLNYESCAPTSVHEARASTLEAQLCRRHSEVQDCSPSAQQATREYSGSTDGSTQGPALATNSALIETISPRSRRMTEGETHERQA